MKFSEKIVFMRKKRGISQDRVAKKMGVSRQTVYKWEADINTPEFNKIKRLSEIFDISYDLLLDDSIDLEKYFGENNDVKEYTKEQPAVKSKDFEIRKLISAIVITLAIVVAFVVIILINNNKDSNNRDVDTIESNKTHIWSDWEEKSKGNCSTPQLLERKCLNCGEKQEMSGEILADHIYVDGACKICLSPQYTQEIEYTVDNGVAYVSSYYGSDETVSISPYFIPEGENVCYPVRGVKELDSYMIKELIIPEGVSIIGGNQFNCPNLEVLRLPTTLTKIYTDAFILCTKLNKVYISDIKSWCNVSVISKKTDDISIFPRSYNMYLNDKLLTNLHISSDIYYVGDYMFAKCASIKALTMAEDSENVRIIGKRAFFNSGLEYAQIDCTAMEEKAFALCYNLKSVKIMARASISHDDIFSHCYHLVEVYTNAGLQTGDSYRLGGVAEYARIVHSNLDEKSVLTKTEDGFVFARVNEVNYLVEYMGSDLTVRLPRSFNGEQYVIARNFCVAENLSEKMNTIYIPKEISQIEKEAFVYVPKINLCFEVKEPLNNWEQELKESEYTFYNQKLDY